MEGAYQLDFRQLKQQKLAQIIHGLRERQSGINSLLATSGNAPHVQAMQLEEQVCDSLANDLSHLMQRMTVGAHSPRGPPYESYGGRGLSPGRGGPAGGRRPASARGRGPAGSYPSHAGPSAGSSAAGTSRAPHQPYPQQQGQQQRAEGGPSSAADGNGEASELGAAEQQQAPAKSKAKLERERKMQDPAYREKERARKRANMDRKIAARKAAAQQADQEGGEGDDEEEAGLPEDVPGAQE